MKSMQIFASCVVASAHVVGGPSMGSGVAQADPASPHVGCPAESMDYPSGSEREKVGQRAAQRRRDQCRGVRWRESVRVSDSLLTAEVCRTHATPAAATRVMLSCNQIPLAEGL